MPDGSIFFSRPIAEPRHRRRHASAAPLLLVTPLLASLCVMLVYPTIWTVALSLTRSTLGRPFSVWRGLDNFAAVLAGSYPWEVLRTVAFTVPLCTVQLAFGLGVALLLQSVSRRGTWLRSLLLVPLLTPPVMAGIAWKLLLATEGGWINASLLHWGITSQAIRFLADPAWAWVSLALADTWQWTPFVALLCYAALLGLPLETREAAVLDGAGAWHVFRYITLPQVLPALAAILLLRVVIGFKAFDLIYVLTFGGPGDATMFASFRIWRTAFQAYDVGVAAAQTLLLGVVVTIATAPFSWLHARAARIAT